MCKMTLDRISWDIFFEVTSRVIIDKSILRIIQVLLLVSINRKNIQFIIQSEIDQLPYSVPTPDSEQIFRSNQQEFADILP